MDRQQAEEMTRRFIADLTALQNRYDVPSLITYALHFGQGVGVIGGNHINGSAPLPENAPPGAIPVDPATQLMLIACVHARLERLKNAMAQTFGPAFRRDIDSLAMSFMLRESPQGEPSRTPFQRAVRALVELYNPSIAIAAMPPRMPQKDSPEPRQPDMMVWSTALNIAMPDLVLAFASLKLAFLRLVEMAAATRHVPAPQLQSMIDEVLKTLPADRLPPPASPPIHGGPWDWPPPGLERD